MLINDLLHKKVIIDTIKMQSFGRNVNISFCQELDTYVLERETLYFIFKKLILKYVLANIFKY